MPVANNSTPARRVARELRKAGIPARVHRKDENILVFPTLGPDDVIAVRMLNPAAQKLILQCGLTSKPKKK